MVSKVNLTRELGLCSRCMGWFGMFDVWSNKFHGFGRNETQDICLIVERHSNRYGVPAFIYVDNLT